MNYVDQLCLWLGRMVFLLSGLMSLPIIIAVLLDKACSSWEFNRAFFEFCVDRLRKRGGE